MFRKSIAAVSLLVVLLAIATYTTGSETCCSHCGCHAHLKKVCRLVCDTKKVTETNYGAACEDICLPGKSHKCGCEWIPTCGKVKTVKKLVKIETTKVVPIYKCVVEIMCGDCCDRLAANGSGATVKR